jgi:citrate lyase subunit beta/citryl-CoA lyase
MMFVPGNNPGMLQNAGIYGADTIIFDVEDSVALTEKDAARDLVYHALKYMKYPCEVAVRINPIETPFGIADLKAILPAKPNLIRLPKVETVDDVRQVDQMITEAEKECGFAPGSIKMMGAIESGKGILNAYSIMTASSRMVAIAIGGEDFVADLKTTRSKDGKELFAARGHLVLAGRAAGIDIIDSVFADVDDEEGFIAETKMIKEMGFDGKSVINPRQIKLVHDIFAPAEKEIEDAKRVLAAYEEALAKKSGVIALDGKMIDTPIVIRAQRVLDYAVAVGGKFHD